jgi:peptidoglycan/xylan/chitin deacetylase (PgdA/CDA1 family)
LGSLQVEQPEHRALLPTEMIELQNDGLIEIGAHTMTHPILSRLPISEQEEEIRESKALLENILGKTITGFAYPNGFFTEQTEALVKEMGFNYACSSRRDVIWQQSPDLPSAPLLAQRLERRSFFPRLEIVAGLIMDSMLASKIVVIILTYRQPEKTLECLSYLTA